MSTEAGKKRRVLISLGIVLAVVILVLSIARPFARPDMERIAVVSLTGAIVSDEGSLFAGPSITPELVKEYLRRAERDATVKAIVLRVDSPGGSVPPSLEILEEIERVKENRPVVVVMENMAASGGYYISTGADKIVALPVALTGSIGVISQAINIEELFDKLGIKVQTFKGGKYKDMYSGLRELTEEEEAIMQGLVDEYYEHFIDVVSSGRGLSREEVRDLATGQLYTGAEAMRLGLVDELGGVETAIALAAELAGVEHPVVVQYQPPRRGLRALFGFGDALRVRLYGLSAQDIILLEILSQSYPQPKFLYQG